mmetsp:Transcript_39500/g.65134  ORF Transcript_39500/g.65134 Transcript_39500/m.65134 type:complete len:204 (+) Transcript_39500:229-840(+)
MTRYFRADSFLLTKNNKKSSRQNQDKAIELDDAHSSRKHIYAQHYNSNAKSERGKSEWRQQDSDRRPIYIGYIPQTNSDWGPLSGRLDRLSPPSPFIASRRRSSSASPLCSSARSLLRKLRRPAVSRGSCLLPLPDDQLLLFLDRPPPWELFLKSASGAGDAVILILSRLLASLVPAPLAFPSPGTAYFLAVPPLGFMAPRMR